MMLWLGRMCLERLGFKPHGFETEILADCLIGLKNGDENENI